MGKLLLAYPPTSESPEARANAITEIQRATESCAIANDCVVILDVSGRSLNDVPLVISFAEGFDLTEEVIQRLRQ